MKSKTSTDGVASDITTPAMGKLRTAMRKLNTKKRDITRKVARMEKACQRDADRWFKDNESFEAWGLLDLE